MRSIEKFLGDAWAYVRRNPWKTLVGAIVLFLAATAISTYISNSWAFRDDDPDRGALVTSSEAYGEAIRSIAYLDQGWRPEDTMWFDSVTQGSDLVPYDFFLVLKNADGSSFRDNDRMNRLYRYLPRKPTYSNPDGLPIGLVKDNYDGRNYMGFTCSACHTGQVNYKGQALRIDGAPAMADMDTFLDDMSRALSFTQTNAKAQAAFVQAVLALKGDYCKEDQVKADLKTYAQRLLTYRIVNRSDTKYGFARLDAFGRIYNQVLQYVITVEDVDAAVNELINEGTISKADFDKAGVTKILDELRRKTRSGGVLNGKDRDAILAAVGNMGLKKAFYFRDKIFNAPDAPVSYPFLWDIPQHDYVQWNGIASNAGLGPIGRNTGEVVGVFGTMDWSRSNHWTLAGVFSGQGLLNSHPINYRSSVNIHNLALIEDKLKTLESPVWPAQLFGKLDPQKVWRGQTLFTLYCAACHAPIDRSSPDRRVVAHFSAQSNIHTDRQMAANSAGYTGYSGILRNSYVTVGPGAILIDRKSPVAALLTKSVTGVVATPDADKWWGQRFIEWLYDVIFSLRNNNIDASMKAGDYTPDTTQAPLSSIMSYKGRSLNGIWATAPYLHNGSVPNLYDLLLPAAPVAGDPVGTQYRPPTFWVGSREFDPVHVGFLSDKSMGFEFLTAKLGNSNAGHEYGTRDSFETNPDGSVALNPDGSKKVKLKALTDAQRMDLVEYLKSL